MKALIVIGIVTLVIALSLDRRKHKDWKNI